MAIFGAIAGSKEDKVQSSQSIEMKGQSADELKYLAEQNASYDELKKLVAAGGNDSDVSRATGATRSFADMLAEYAKTGGMPSESDLSTSNRFAESIFNPQRTKLNQVFEDQKVQAARLSASLGRSVDDPILQAKLRTNMMNNMASLESEQGAYGSQLALQMPGQKLGYAQNNVNVLQGLASQAFQNRSALLSLGNQLGNQEYQKRFQESTKHAENVSGGGFKGAVAGGLSGLSAVLDVVGMFYGKPPSGKDGSTGLKSNATAPAINDSVTGQAAYGTPYQQAPAVNFTSPQYGDQQGYAGYGARNVQLS